MDHIPDRVHIRYFVGKEFQKIKGSGDSEDPGMRKNFKLCGEMNYSEAVEQAQGGHGRVQIQARRKSSAEHQAESFDRGHAVMLTGRSNILRGAAGAPSDEARRA